MQQPLNNEVKMMRSFNNYIKSKELFDEDAALELGRAAVGRSSFGEKQKEQLGNLFKVIELIADGYLSDLKSFLKRMSGKNEEIEKLVEKIEKDGWSSLHQAGTRATSGLDPDDENNLAEPEGDSFDEPDQLAQHDTGDAE